MQLRRLGNSGLKISAIGLGGNTFGRTVDGDEAIAVIRRALDLGITFVDTADVYAFGRSEELVGQALAGRRTEVVLATKCGMAMDDGPHRHGLSRRWIVQALEDSLRRLGTRAGDLSAIRQRLTDARLAAVERLRPWAEARGHTTAELAIAWLLSYPEVSSVIVGARSAAQVEANVRAGDWSLSPAERDEALA